MGLEIELQKAKPRNEELKKAKPQTLPNNENGRNFDEKHEILMKKCEKSIEKYKNRVIWPKPWFLIHGKKSRPKS